MDPELQRFLELAQRAKAGGVSDADIDKALKGRGAPTFAELTRLAQAGERPQEPPMKPSFLQRIGTALTAGPTQTASPGADLAATRARRSEQRLRGQLQPQADISRMVGRGMTLGLSEEIVAAPRLVTGLFGGKTFGEARQAEQEKTAAARERLGPGGSFTAEMAGALAIPGKAGAEIVRKGASILGKMGRGAGLGAGIGAVVGAADAPGEDVGIRAVTGASLGVVFGGALPLAGALIAVPRKIASVIFGPFSPTRAGLRVHREEMRALGTILKRKPGELEADFALQRTRRPGLVTPADIDPQLGKFVASRAPDATGQVAPLTQTVQRRGIGRGERLAEELPGLSRTGRLEEAQAVVQARLDALSPQLYKPLERAYPTVTDPRLTKFLDNPRVKKFWNRVKPEEGEPGLVHWQELRGELTDEIAALKRKDKPFARRRVQRQHDELTEILEKIVPGFRAANLQYYQTAVGIRSFDTGAQAYKKFWSGDEVERAIAKIQESAGPEANAAVEAFRHGYVDEMMRALLSKSGKTTAQRLAQMNESQRRALRAAFGNSKEGFEEFLERAVLEDRLSALTLPTGARAVMGGQGSLEAGIASPIVGFRFQAIRELFRRARPVREAAAADATLTRLLSTDPRAMSRLTAAMRAPGGGGPGLLTGALPGPIGGLLSGRQQ